MRALLRRLRERLAGNPRLLRFLGVLGLVAIVGFPIASLVPRGLDVDYDLGQDHSNYNTLRVAYLPVGQDATRAFVQRFEHGAPATYRHHVDLAPGPYEIHARLEGEDDVQEVSVRVRVGRESHVRIRVQRGIPLP